MTPTVYFGIDTSKKHLDLADSQGFYKQFDNAPRGICSLVAYLRKEQATHVAIEATGRYHQAAVRGLHAAGFQVYVVQPGRVRAFAKSQGRLAKNDRIDGCIIARFAECSDGLRPYEPPSEAMERLRALTLRRDQVVDDRKREKTRLEAAESKEIRAMITASISGKDEEIKRLDCLIDDALKATPDVKALCEQIQKAKGVGPITALVLVTQLPELGRMNRQEVAAMAGLAPYDHDSGNHRGKRCIYGGRSRVRTALYMAAVSAKTYEKEFLKPLFTRLVERGKKPKVAMIAVARKLLVYVNSLAADFYEQRQVA